MVAYRQTYEIIRGIQEKAAEQCAPVIFGIKPSNLLIIEQSYAKALKSLVETTGLKVRCFEHREERQVWFMFREEPLYRQLMDPDNRAFMKQFGYTEDMTMDEMLALPGVNVADLFIISELQKSIKANKVISYLSEKTEAREETKGADYGGTT